MLSRYGDSISLLYGACPEEVERSLPFPHKAHGRDAGDGAVSVWNYGDSRTWREPGAGDMCRGKSALHSVTGCPTLLARAADFGSATGDIYMSSKKAAAARPPESRLKKFVGYVKALFKIISGLMLILKTINKAWSLLQKLMDWFI